jgi:hypothetical protein
MSFVTDSPHRTLFKNAETDFLFSLDEFPGNKVGSWLLEKTGEALIDN